MPHQRPFPPSAAQPLHHPNLLSHDEAIGLAVALACAVTCVLVLWGAATPALAEDASAASLPPESHAPLIIVVVIMGVALGIAFAVSHRRNRPRKLGGSKGDVW